MLLLSVLLSFRDVMGNIESGDIEQLPGINVNGRCAPDCFQLQDSGCFCVLS